LTDFTNWCIQNYPADNYALILWDHGSGWKNISLLEVTKGICWDVTNSDYLTTLELRSALFSIYTSNNIKLDIVAFDSCLMGMIEVG